MTIASEIKLDVIAGIVIGVIVFDSPKIRRACLKIKTRSKKQLDVIQISDVMSKKHDKISDVMT